MLSLFGHQIFIYKDLYEMKLDISCFKAREINETKYQFKSANIGDIDNFNSSYFGVRNLRLFKSLLRRHSDKFLMFKICDNNNNIIGYCSANLKKSNDIFFKVRKCDAYISSLFINDDYRGKGLGLFGIENILQQLFLYNCKNIKISVKVDNEKAISLYKKVGFYIVKRHKFIRFLRINIPQYYI